jgi:DNA-directed RNA polymerase alpha subunit
MDVIKITYNGENVKLSDEKENAIRLILKDKLGLHPLLNINIRSFCEKQGFGPRTWNCPTNLDCYTFGDLLKVSEKELLRLANFGPKALTELKEALEILNTQNGTSFHIGQNYSKF